MVSFDSEVLQTDPAKIALGSGTPTDATDNAGGPACDAARSAFRTAAMFRVLFTSFVVVLAFATLVALVFFIYRASKGWDAATAASLVGTVVSGVASGFLGKKMTEAIAVQNRALANVAKYCGSEVHDQLK